MKILKNLPRRSVTLSGGTLLLCASLLIACGESDTDAPVDPGDRGEPDGPCAYDARLGGFTAALQDGFTSVQGTVANGVQPALVPEVVATDGACQLMRPPTLFCDPSCGSGQTCDASGTCIDSPINISVGAVTVTGLKAPVSMSSSPPVFFYTNLDPLDHPGFDEGDDVQLISEGSDELDRFTLDARGVAALDSALDSVLLDVGMPVTLAWTAPGQSDVATIHIDLNIAQHGGTPGWIECEAPDTGEFELPVSLTDQLLAAGFSGFPSVAMTRRSADSTDTALGCVQWSVESTKVLSVDIPGLISCSDNDDCPTGQICQGDLTCG